MCFIRLSVVSQCIRLCTILPFRSVPIWQCFINSLLIDINVFALYFPSDWYLSFRIFGTCMQNLMVDIGFCVLSMFLLVSCSDHWGRWVDYCVNQWSWIDHCHPRASMCVGSACAWKACMGRSQLHQGHQCTYITAAILKMSECCIQCLLCLNLEF